MAANKTVCPVSRSEFNQHAVSIPVKIGDTPLTAEVKAFSTGSLGHYYGGKMTVMIGGKPCQAQVGLSIILVGSKELPA